MTKTILTNDLMPCQYRLGETLLNISQVGLSYGPKLILRDVTLLVKDIIRDGLHQGQVIGLLGGSGVGKTQLLRCVAGLQQPSQGGIFLKGNEQPVQAGEVGFVFQNYPLLKHRTVWSQLKLAARGTNSNEETILLYLDRFGIPDKKDYYPNQLSGGQRQRVAIIQQMLCASHFMMMDEPFSGLDVRMKDEVCKLILEVSVIDSHNTTVLTTHDIPTAVSVCDTIWILGYEKDAQGNRIPGATCIKKIDLIERGLTWIPNPRDHPSFVPTVREIADIFMKN